MDWQDFEKTTRKIAHLIWGYDPISDTINGVRIDALCKRRDDYWVVIEITQENTLDKLRTDLAKFSSIRPYLFSQNIYPECYFVTESKPNQSLVVTGKGNNVEVLSLESLSKKFIDYKMYSQLRDSRPFGSAIVEEPETGQFLKDKIKYVPVQYMESARKIKYTIEDLARLLAHPNRLVLTGDYGTGKSRCTQELFSLLTKEQSPGSSIPLAINLRDHWGSTRWPEIIRRHFDDLGLSKAADNAIKALPMGGIILLLDGFDEIASQTWSDDPSKLKDIRVKSLIGVKDLIKNTSGGVIITGREHYFNSNEEMFQCLGLDPRSTILLECQDEFNEEEMALYLKNININIPIPDWLPRRPLIFKIVSEIDATTIKYLLQDDTGEVQFWEHFIRAVCDREARIGKVLDGSSIKKILCYVADLTRSKPNNLGPINVAELNQAFEAVIGKPPTDPSAIVLQRLPTIQRVESDSPDRQFVDSYILDGLRAESLIEDSNTQVEDKLQNAWLNPLKRFGITVVADYIEFMGDRTSIISYMRKAAQANNPILACDIISALCAVSNNIDFHHIRISNDGYFSYLDFSEKIIKNLLIENSFIEILDITDITPSDIVIKDCIIDEVIGVSGARGLPDWIINCAIEKYQSVSTVSRIRSIKDLPKPNQMFLTIIKKTFFQPGSGRKEEALLRGWGAQADHKLANSIVNMLLDMEVLKKYKGDEGWVYIPNRSFTRRMVEIREQLTTSEDPIWKKLDSI